VRWRDIVLSLGRHPDELAFNAPAGALTVELRRRIIAHKADIIELLFEAEERAALSGCPDWRDAQIWFRAVNSPPAQALARLVIEKGRDAASARRRLECRL
jgi:hypothetical protein